MKKEYVKPFAEKITFDYKQQIVASKIISTKENGKTVGGPTKKTINARDWFGTEILCDTFNL